MTGSNNKTVSIPNTHKLCGNKACKLYGAAGSVSCFFCRRGVNYLDGTERLPETGYTTYQSRNKTRSIQRTENWKNTYGSGGSKREPYAKSLSDLSSKFDV